MAERKKSDPHFEGVGQGPRAGKPNIEVNKDSAQAIAEAEKKSIGRPANSGKMAQDSGSP